MEFLKAIILGIVQGITEWLPVSSTGHMILVDEFIKLDFSQVFISTFFVVIQFGSILAVLFLYFKKLNPFDPSKTKMQREDTISLWLKVIIAVIPSGIIGLLFDDKIEEIFFNPTTVAIMLIVYGVIFIILESRNKKPKIETFSQLTYKTAIFIGCFQVLALIPGTSRFVAAEFSFFLAIPTMLGASALKLVKAGFAFNALEWGVLLTGCFVAFIVSVIAIKFLMDYIKKHDFKFFGYYIIILGILVLGYFYVLA